MLNLLAGAKWNAAVVAATNDGETKGAARPDHHHADRAQGHNDGDGCYDDGHDNIAKMGEAENTLEGLDHYDDDYDDDDDDDDDDGDDDDDNDDDDDLQNYYDDDDDDDGL